MNLKYIIFLILSSLFNSYLFSAGTSLPPLSEEIKRLWDDRLNKKIDKIKNVLKDVSSIDELKKFVKKNLKKIDEDYINELQKIGIEYEEFESEIFIKEITPDKKIQFNELNDKRERKIAAIKSPVIQKFIEEEIERREKEQGCIC